MRRKRNSENVLNILSEHSNVSGYKFERLYRILFNEQMFYAALSAHFTLKQAI